MKKHLKDHGFKKKYTPDKSGYWYQLNIPHKLIYKLYITVDIELKMILVWFKEPKKYEVQIG